MKFNNMPNYDGKNFDEYYKLVRKDFENVKLSIFVPKNKIDCLNSNNINEFNITNMKKEEKTHTKNP